MRSLFNQPKAVLCALLLLPSALFARFSEELSPQDRSASGITQLTPTQIACIDALVQRELSFAKQGRTKAFAQSFTVRRTDRELEITGIPTLSEGQQETLNSIVARLIASTNTNTAAPAAAQSLSNAEGVTTEKAKWEVHGTVSLFVGGDLHGGSFYGGSLETTLTDPKGRYELALGYSQIRSKGMVGCLGLWPYDYDQSLLPYYRRGMGIMGPRR